MAGNAQPWRERAALAALAASWRARLVGRAVGRLAGGPGWLRLTLESPSAAAPEAATPPAHVHLTARSGAVLAWDTPDLLPRPVHDALSPVRPRDLTVTPRLRDAVLRDVAVAADDRVLYLIFSERDGGELRLAVQFFGPRGNLVLAEVLPDGDGRRLWSAHASPHPATLDSPPTASSTIDAETADVAAAACRKAAPAILADVLARDAATRADTALRRARDAAQRLRDNLARDLDRADRGEADRRAGETLAIHLHELAQGPASVELADAAGEPLRIDLDPALSPAANMERCFKRARKAERGRAVIADRLETAQARLDVIDAAAAALPATVEGDGVARLAALAEWRLAHAELLGPERRPGAPRAGGPIVTALPYRRYLIEGKWEVWVGRGAKENDETTHKCAGPRDWWLHAQGVSGSHVILRSEGKPEQVPKRVLELAARLAAQYSKARNSGLVPVLYTQRRYVRKPRKSPPGTAATLQAKTVMVEPGVPEGTEILS